MPLTPYTESVNNGNFGLQNTNAPGSPYALAYSRGVTTHLSLPVDPKIFDAAPQQFLDLQFLMAFMSEQGPSDECIWHENPWGRAALQFNANFAGVAASPGTEVTGTITLTDATDEFAYPSQKITYGTTPNQTQATVVSVDTGAHTAVIRSMTGVALGAATSGDYITNGMTAGGDGGQFFPAPTRIQTIQRSNLVELIGPEQAFWNERERKKFKAMQQTDFMDTDVRERLRQLKVSICQRVWFGQYAQTVLATDGRIAKMTAGIVPSIINGGGAQLNATMSTAWDVIRTGMFQTNYGAIDNRRVIFGTPEMLDALNLKAKAELIRYTPESQTYDMGFERWRFGGMEVTLVPTQIWGDVASFPTEFQRRLVVLQQENVKLYSPTWEPMIQQNLVTQSRYNTTPAEIYDYERYFCQAAVGVKVMNPPSSYIVDIA